MWSRFLWACNKPLCDAVRLEKLLIESANFLNSDTMRGTNLVGLKVFIMEDRDMNGGGL